jgi:hypothetical protein
VTLDKRNGRLFHKAKEHGAQNMGGETRRNFILAGSAQALFALEPNKAFAQSSPAPVHIVPRPRDEILNNLLVRSEFKSALNFPSTFQRMFVERLELSLGTLAAEANSAISEVITRTQAVLVKDFGENVPIPKDDLLIIIGNTVLVQNVLFALATDIASGLVTITTQAIQAAFDKYCSDYPYCGKIKPKKQ